MSDDLGMMTRALELAARGRGRVEPNPMVGAVVSAGDEMAGEGFHERFGGPHAEINALGQAGARARGATLYVTLEPCCHFGKTPPCTRAVIQAGIRRVVMAMEDPFPSVAGNGRRELEAAGIHVTTGVLEDKARALNAPYLKLRTRGIPYFTAKWAMTLDGKTATRTGDSRWVSGESSRHYVHELRSLSDAVLVGLGTVLADDPELTARIPDGRNPRRIVVDSRARLPLDCRLVRTRDQAPLTVAVTEEADAARVAKLEAAGLEVLKLPARQGRVDLDALAGALGKTELTNVLSEAGARLTAGLFQTHLIDRVVVFIAPKLVGGTEAPSPLAGLGIDRMSGAVLVDNLELRTLDQDVVIEGTVTYARGE